MVAVPVIVGSLGRIPLGALTDRYGGRIVFASLSFVVIAPVLFLAFATAYPALLLGGLFLGLGGASFAVGGPFVNAWVPPERRGFALGVYGMGNIGTAISGFVSPRVASSMGRPWAFLIVAFLLALVGLAFLVLGRDAPPRRVRGLRGLPADLPQDRLRAGDDRRGHPGGRVRGPGHPGPPGRRLAGGPDLRGAGDPVGPRGGRGRGCGHRLPAPHRRRHHRLPDHGGRPRARQRGRVR